MTKTTTTKPDVLALGDALQAQRQAADLAEARARLSDAMARFDELEPEYARVRHLAADFERWKDKYGRAWVRAEPGINFVQLDAGLESVVQITQFPGVVARARELYATMTVEGSAYAERTIRSLLRSAEGIETVEETHRALQLLEQELDAMLARRIANKTLQPPAPRGLAPATSEAVSRGPRRAASRLSDA